MMRSLFSGVAGLKTHQTRMDVIGNNIANVNTTAYKSQSMVFNDLLYQTTQAASGANATTGRGGINARQIGLGAKTGAIKTAITQQGSAQSTNDPFDIMITGDAFFIVSNGSQNFFTRDGSFTVDGAGNLVMTSTGYTVMGWLVDESGEVRSDSVAALQVMNDRFLTYDAESTTNGYISGILDENDTNVNGSGGRVVTMTFFDRRGYSYTAKFSIHSTDEQGRYTVQLDDILDSTGVSLVKKYNLNSINDVATFGGNIPIETTAIYDILSTAYYDATAAANGGSGYFKYVDPLDILDIDDKAQRLLDLAEKHGKWWISEIAGTAYTEETLSNVAISEGDGVKISGNLTLDKDTLEALGVVMWDDSVKKYRAVKKNADGTIDSGAVGDIVDSQTDWETVLAELGVTDLDATNPYTVDEYGNATFNFVMDKTAQQDATARTAKQFAVEISQMEAYGLENVGDTSYTINFITEDGERAQVTKIVQREGFNLVYDAGTGKFSYVDTTGNDSVILNFNPSTTNMLGEGIDLSMFTNIDIDFSATSNIDNGGVSTVGGTNGMLDNPTVGAGRKAGDMIGIEVAQDGTIRASYDNGMTRILGQIAVAVFANASGLAKEGDNLYSATMNSGEFDGVGQDITADGSGYMTSGVLEMSNVDLSSEFTEMITTQRGFQANSRIITVSDTLLEELVNLKR